MTTSPEDRVFPMKESPSVMKCRSFSLLILAILATAALLPGVSCAVELPVTLHGGGVFFKEVESWKARRMQKMIPQAYDFSCGAAAIATVLKYYFGNQVTEKDAILGMIKNGNIQELRQRGFSLLDMKRYIESLHYEAGGFQIKNIEILKRLPMPLITLVKTQRYNHFVVIRHVDDTYIYTADPSWGNRRIPLADFDQAWSPKVIFAIAGPVAGSPEGLYQETDDSKTAVYEVLRSGPGGSVGHRLPIDPSQAMFFNGSRGSVGLPLPFINGR